VLSLGRACQVKSSSISADLGAMARSKSKWNPSAPVAIFLTLVGIAIVGTLWRVILLAFALLVAAEIVAQGHLAGSDGRYN
jgi:hypothetical protein